MGLAVNVNLAPTFDVMSDFISHFETSSGSVSARQTLAGACGRSYSIVTDLVFAFDVAVIRPSP